MHFTGKSNTKFDINIDIEDIQINNICNINFLYQPQITSYHGRNKSNN
jgi:hypothetical protein